MNVIDIIILVCCAPAVIHGLSKGFVSQAFSLLGLILGVWVSFRFSGAFADWLASFADLPSAILHLVAFAVTLFVTIVLIHLAGKAVAKAMKVVMLGWLDKLLGVLFSLLTMLLLLGLLVTLFDALNSAIPLVPSKTIEGSALYQPVKELADLMFPYLKELILKK